MNPSTPPPSRDNPSREEMLSALFANMVIQNTNMAIMMLGKAPHPETGETVQDLETAQVLIDQLEMLEVKTKGNLNKQEEGLLKQALGALRMAYVQTVNEPGASFQPPAPETKPAASSEPAPAQESPPKPAAPASSGDSAPAPEESRKKFSKKY